MVKLRFRARGSQMREEQKLESEHQIVTRERSWPRVSECVTSCPYLASKSDSEQHEEKHHSPD